jgi:toxin YoeB
MEKFRIIIKPKAENDFTKIIRSGDTASIKKLEAILIELSDHPKEGIGNPEQLKYQLTGYWSRRINKRDRLVYEIIEEPDMLVVIISALGHYELD